MKIESVTVAAMLRIAVALLRPRPFEEGYGGHPRTPGVGCAPCTPQATFSGIAVAAGPW